MIKESIHSTITVSISKQFEMAQPFFLPSLAGNFGHVALEQYWFRFQTFHVLNLTHWIKYMKSLMSESIRNTYGQPFFLSSLAGNFGLWSDFGVALIQMPKKYSYKILHTNSIRAFHIVFLGLCHAFIPLWWGGLHDEPNKHLQRKLTPSALPVNQRPNNYMHPSKTSP